MTWHTQTPEQILASLKSQADGLSTEESTLRLTQYGPNELVDKGIKSPWSILKEQLTSVMVLILLAAAGLSAILADYQDALVILAIVVFFVSLGVFQEYQAEKAIAALKSLAVPAVRVRRNRQQLQIPAPELVPGDILLLEAGDQVPADARILVSHSLKVQEAALTGESEAVQKQVEALADEHAPLGDRLNLLYMGTNISYGRGEAVVVSTGMQTELGHIANLIQGVSSGPTPLQRKLDQVGKNLAILALVFSALIVLVGLFRNEAWRLMLMSGISVAVAAVPEGLPAVLTITLAFGSKRMLARHALVRKLTGIETLGSVSVICSDKTGTLTQNKMTVQDLFTLDSQLALNGSSAEELKPELHLLAVSAVLCNDSQIEGQKELGDPTELALLYAAEALGLKVTELRESIPRIEELPFDSERKRMTTVHQREHLNQLENTLLAESQQISFTKGSIDGLLDQSSHVLYQGQWQELNEELRQQLEAANQQLAQQGRRVLGFALKHWQQDTQGEVLEAGLSFIGLMGMIDPPRPEVFEAVKICKEAGIRPIMITGDHPLTALKIAQELGITENQDVLTGRDLQNMQPGQLGEVLKKTSVFARVSPEHKLRIVEALQAQNQVVAMTGDGVNDAPALKKADIGVAMGITGTDVSKEAADMVLQDDNFATIVAAVEEGRIIFDNLRKFIKFSVAGNLGKILVMLLAPILGMPLALQPIQMLWLNLLTDGLLGFGLGLEQAERNIMQRKPSSPDENILGGAIRWQIGWMGVLIGGISMSLAYWHFVQNPNGPWQTVLFSSLAVAQIFQALAIRSGSDSLLVTGLSNPVLWGMIIATVCLQTAVVYLPFLQGLFHTQALGLQDFLIIGAANSLILVIAEVLKLLGKKV